MRKKQRPTLDVQITPMQHAWLDVLGVDAPWLERAPVVMKNQAVDVLAEGGGVITKTPVAPQPVSPPKPAHAREKIAQPTPTAVKVLPASFASIVARPHHGLDDLAQQISSCQACNLCQARQQVVVGAGVMQPAIMIVGEAPGEQEDRQGLPFVGKSGELLDSMLAAIGRHRDRDVYITNVVKCRPPANRAPRVEEVAACLPFLLAQIKAIQPKIILAMGRSAAHALLSTDAQLHQLRDQVWSIDVNHSASAAKAESQFIPMIVTYHPAYLLHKPTDKKLAWQDLQKARDLIA